METDEQEYEMLDLLAFKCSALAEQLKNEQSALEQETMLQEYLQKIEQTFDSITDFTDDMHWFNVSEQLSINKQLKGKIVVLDFFTYCCINCMHILPDLKRLEERVTMNDGLVVIGVHSPKFNNEKSSANILSAIQRYNITHPVVNDAELHLWSTLHIQCWPTLLILGPRGNPIFVLMGESHSATLNKYVDAAIRFYGDRDELSHHELPISLASELLKPTMLQFPGKIASRALKNGNDAIESKVLYAVTDSGNHRVIIFRFDGQIVHTIGGKESGFADGNFRDARFHAPQGITFYTDGILYVTDTENHAVREIDLDKKRVSTIAGNGVQSTDHIGGLVGTAQGISSPWDVAMFRTPNMDMSFHDDNEPVPEKDVILVAMAGTHQVWAIFKSETIWWKFKKYAEGTVVAIAGSGSEENRNNSYPMNAAFAQPSGLAMCTKEKELYIADSESSSIRKVLLANGKVSAVAGGDRNPLNLFEFGDQDGVQTGAKFQHPLGVAFDSSTRFLYVADTYNNKIRAVQTANGNVTTCYFKDDQGNDLVFNEPSALCMSPCNQYLLVCNSNNHTIEVIRLATSVGSTLNLRSEPKHTLGPILPLLKTLTAPELLIREDGAKISLALHLVAGKNSKFILQAPQRWRATFSNQSWTMDEMSDDFVKTADVDDSNRIIKLKRTLEINATASDPGNEISSVDVAFNLNLCSENQGICFPKHFNIILPFKYSPDGGADISHTADIYVDLARMEWLSDQLGK